MGTVYKARDSRLQRLVALKLLTSGRRPDSARKKRFLREARAAAALNHPHIVTVHDVDSLGELDYVVMELVSGTSLDRRIPEDGLPLDQALDFAVQIAGGLAAAHAAGVIHRDLKPSNVMVTDEGQVKILDFGLAKVRPEGGDDVVDVTAITQEGTILGSVGFMSPEQALGQPVDGRADVFSFGALLYQMLTGQRPFQGDNHAVVIYRACYADYEPIEQVRPGVPEWLRHVVARALAKEAENRYPTIEDLLADLEGARTGTAAAPAVASPETRAEEPPFLTRSGGEASTAESVALVARDDELARLAGWLAAALDGHGRVGFVTGEAGNGKTALVTELARRAQGADPGLVTGWGNCNAHTGIGDPYLPFREILRMLSGDVEARWAAGAINREQATRLWHLSPHVARALLETAPELIETFVPAEPLLARAAAVTAGRPDWLVRFEEIVRRGRGATPPGQPPSDVLKVYSELIRAVARHRPLLLVLDDLQWADAGSVALLFHLGRQIAGDRILILGVYRPADVTLGRGGERHPLAEVLHELRRLFGDVEVEVGELRGRQFVDAFLDTQPNRLGAGFREALWRQTRGQPLFTIEFLRALEQQGGLTRDGDGRWVVGSELDWRRFPARVEAAIGERVDRLPGRLRQILDVASVEGTELTAEVVAGALGTDPYEVVQALSRELDKRHRLVTACDIRQVGGRRLSRYRFRHILFHQYVYGALDPVERAHLHDRIGGLLEELHAGLLELAESAQDPALLVEALHAMGHTLDGTGRHREAREVLERAATAALAERDLRPNPVTGHDVRVSSLSVLALVLWQLGDADQARERSRQAAAVMRRLDHPFSLAFGLSFQMLLQYYLRDQAAVQEVAAELLALCEDEGFPFWAAFGAQVQGWALATTGSASDDGGQSASRRAPMSQNLVLPRILSICTFLYQSIQERTDRIDGLNVGEDRNVDRNVGL